ncbi:YbhB/YbcL family Raf kinase inhibitor-like protein [Chitinophaga nivalis]|uniref:YbhB/YbcL family Raf kinase inhibitor-like protein n=1 Tax=Chitinophaga nivalis TaxID=2991709 RepID=A0ABT3II54_9BACT|nr:YbhB/YbcL family Raf kinase inhibitor-like protein [Chitinophaga nivalis]MCW3466668.1 YbhB/YbcL family Raf kinase inhibitor-like protein [Chitinophaga nivalis]MCW3483641.1 YbhB/YbcL family Raf kinase inhibitor-like protein [Chitinophaga nivalis]
MATAISNTSDSHQTFTLKSNTMGGQLPNQQYANGMGFNGENQSPQLYWEHAPEETQGFAVTMYDLDAPTGSGFWHWVVFNIPSHVHELVAGSGDPGKDLLPEGAIQSHTDAGTPGYIGAAPNAGPAHRYLITVHALSKTLALDKNATPAFVGFNLHFATLAKASLVVYAQQS